MGWTFSHRAKGLSDREWFQRQGCFTWSSPDCADYRVIETATVDRKVFHAVLEMNASRRPELTPDENGKVRIALVFLIKWVPNDHYNFGYKDMDEFMGPCETVCPEKILDMLSPIRPEAIAEAEARFAADEAAVAAGKARFAWRSGLLHAASWREACRRLIAVRKATRKPGTRFKLAHPMRFTDGVETSELVAGELYRNQPTFRRPDGMRVSVKRSAFDRLSLA